MRTEITTLEAIIREWTRGADVTLRIWQNARIYITPKNRRYAGWVDVNGKTAIYWAYFRPQLGLNFSDLAQVAAKHGVNFLEF